MHFRKCCAHACHFTTGACFTSALLILLRVSPKRLLAGLPCAVVDDWPCGVESFISHKRGLSQTPTAAPSHLFFFYVIKSDLCFETHRLSSVGRKKGRADCFSCNCEQDQFADSQNLSNENKAAGGGTFSFPVFG